MLTSDANERRAMVLSLRLWLFGLSLTAIVPLLVYCGYVLLNLEQQMFDRQTNELKAQTNQLALRANGRIDRAAILLTTLAASDAAQHNDWASLRAQSKRALETNTNIRAVTLIDRQGRMLFHTSIRFGDPLFQASQTDAVNKVFETGRVNASGTFIAPISPKSVVAVSAPLTQGGQVTHVIRAILLTESLGQLLSDSNLPSNGIAAITDAKGMLLARSEGADLYVGKMASPTLVDAIRNGKDQLDGVTLEGVPVTTRVLPVHGGDWYAALAVPTATLNAPRHIAISRMIVFAVVWVALSFILSLVVANWLSRQAARLVHSLSSAVGDENEQGILPIEEFQSLRDGVFSARAIQKQTVQDLDDMTVQRDEARDLYDNAPCGYHSLDMSGKIVRMNQTELRWLGFELQEVLDRPYMDFVSENSRDTLNTMLARFLAQEAIHDVELDLVRRDGSTLPVLVSATCVNDGNGKLLSSRTTVYDIRERKVHEAELEQLARTDPLTGLTNRRDFYQRAEAEMARAKRMLTPLSVLSLDIDYFKKINDTHGHDAGDIVLKDLGQLCLSELREIDILARFGGEEFMVLMPGTTLDAGLEVAERLRHRLETATVLVAANVPIHYTVSIGLTVLQNTDSSVDDMLKRADLGLYESKSLGRNRVRVKV